MANNVLKTLQSMETELAAIKSAKEQVEAVVAADATINSSLKSYSDALAKLSVKMEDIKQSFEEVANIVTDEANQFGSSLGKRKEEIKNATQELSSLLDNFKKQTEKIGMTTIAQRTEKIDKKCDDLSEKLRLLDKKLSSDRTAFVVDFNKKTNDIIDKISSTKNKVIAGIEGIDDKLTKIDESVTSAERNIDQSISSSSTSIINKIEDTDKSFKNISNGINQHLDTITTEIKQNIAATNKKIMYLGGIGILLLLIDIALHFI